MTEVTSMQALLIEEVDGPFLLREINIPVLGAGQVLVRVKASGVNPLDTKVRAGRAAHARVELPAILGMDVAGIVEAIGACVTTFQPGDEVYGMAGGIGGIPGSLARYMVVDSDLLAIKPRNLSMREAAALPLVVITAWEGLVDRAKVMAGQRVLVHAGAGGVGHVTVQIARALGAEVFATVSESKRQIVEGYGATAIDYRVDGVEEYVARCAAGEGFDIVYDTVGGATLDDSFRAVKTYIGHVVSCLGWGTHSLSPLSFRGATYSGVFTLMPMLTGRSRAHHGEILREVTQLVEAGKLKPLLSPTRYSFENALEAHQAVAEGRSLGKVVVEVEE